MTGDSQVLDPVYVIFQHRGSALLCALPVLFSSIRTKARGPRGLTTRRQRMRTERSRSEAAEETNETFGYDARYTCKQQLILEYYDHSDHILKLLYILYKSYLLHKYEML